MTAESHEFKTELKQLLDIIIHSLYSNKDIFLRELISNACDAIDKLRFESLTDQDLLEGSSDWKIRITADKDNATLTVSDNGIGMSRDSIVSDLGTIARSGTQSFIEQLKTAEAQDRPELIGQFGVGFYASLMVADRVTVISRPAGAGAEAVRWETDGQGTFTVEPAERDGRGTDVILHLKEDDRGYLEPWKIREIVKQYSDFIEHPIVMDREEEKDEDGEKVKTVVEDVLNSQKALWLRPKAEVTEDELKEFYHHVSHHFDDPRKTIHYAAEGVQEFTALMFIPTQKPFDLYWPDAKRGLQLYVKRVFITDHCEKVVPPYLRFLKGVVDSSDLPLNVSREMIQQNPLLDRIRGALVKKVLGTLEEMKKEENDDYLAFYREFGPVLKEGLSDFAADRERLAGLLYFESTRAEPGTMRTLADYVENLPEGDEEIYYLIGENRALVESSPLLESFKARDREVLLLTDPIDEWAIPALREYKGKKLVAVDHGELEEDEKAKEEREETEKEFKDLFGFLAEKIEDVKSVRLSRRLKESAACLVADEGDPGAHMQRLLKRMGREGELPEAKRVLELNAEHPAVKALHGLYEKSPHDPRVEAYGRLLYDQAVIAEGSAVTDPTGLARRINDLLARDATRTGGD
jgi:molecular chaperone HtpG